MSATLSPALGPIVLFVAAFLSNVALAVLPHEPVVIWFGPRLGVLATACIATAGTVAASWADHRLLAPVIWRLARTQGGGAAPPFIQRVFTRAPFAILAASGLTPLPFFPFKLLAFAARYPRPRYLAAVAAGRLPRYALLAWLGVTFQLPTWALALVCTLLLLPALRMLRCPIRNAT